MRKRMDTYLLTRSCYTGLNEYHGFREDRQIGTALAHVLPGFPVSLYSSSGCLACRRNPEWITLSDCDSGMEFARILRDRPGHYRLHTSHGQLEVDCREGIFLISRDGVAIAGLGPVQRGSPFDLAHPEYRTAEREPHMAMMAAEALPDDLALVLLCFPLLRTGL